jgi:transcriptional regulator with XRE-family HTH domain
MNPISERLKKFRDSLGYNQEGIAESVGMKQRTWSDWEKSPPEALQWLVNLSRRYSVSVDYLLTLTDDPTPHKSNAVAYPLRNPEIADLMRLMPLYQQDAILQMVAVIRKIEKEAHNAAGLELLHSVMKPIEEMFGINSAEEFYQAGDLLRRTGDQSAVIDWLARYLGGDKTDDNGEQTDLL